MRSRQEAPRLKLSRRPRAPNCWPRSASRPLPSPCPGSGGEEGSERGAQPGPRRRPHAPTVRHGAGHWPLWPRWSGLRTGATPATWGEGRTTLLTPLPGAGHTVRAPELTGPESDPGARPRWPGGGRARGAGAGDPRTSGGSGRLRPCSGRWLGSGSLGAGAGALLGFSRGFWGPPQIRGRTGHRAPREGNAGAEDGGAGPRAAAARM